MSKRDKIIAVYVTDIEKAHIEATARAKGIPAAVYLRMLALADAGESVAKTPNVQTKPTRK